MKRIGWQAILGFFLIAVSAVFYFIHYVVFHDTHHIFIFLLGDVAFVPVEVLLVTLIIHRLLSEREKRAKMSKLNMVIGAFFSEVGTRLLEAFSRFDQNLPELQEKFVISGDWSAQRFDDVRKRFKGYDFEIALTRENIEELKRFLVGKRGFLLRLLENQTLLEHESFTDLLWAVFHLTEELENREDIGSLPDSDILHLRGDVRRVYTLLIAAWFSYIEHLECHYPYLFSLAMRTNPLNPNVSPVVQP